MSYLFRYYAKVYDRFMSRFHLDDDSVILRMIGSGNKKIADIGGGTGRTADKLIRMGHSVTIIDPCQSMTKRAKKRNPRIRIINEAMPCEIKMRIMEPIPCGSMKERPQEVLTKEEQSKLIALHVEMNESMIYPKVSVFPYIESEDQYGCGAGSQHSFIDADGNFGPCDFLPISYGNLLTEEAELIWSRMHEEIGKPKCTCCAKCRGQEDKLPKYYQLMRGSIK
jgi:hypothetical protein